MTDAETARRLPSTGEPPSLAPGAHRSDRVVAAVLVYGLLFSYVATVYVTVAVLDGLSATNADLDWWAHVIAVGLIAVTVEPVRRWLVNAVDDTVHGHHEDAYDVVTTLGRDVAAGSVATTIARALAVPYVAVLDGELDGGEVVSVAGQAPAGAELTEVPLRYEGETVGRIVVAPRRRGRPLADGDRRLLEDLAHQLGLGMYALRASGQVQASRAALVTAREEERRRIRRDLHDGLGPSLAALKLQLAAAQRLLAADPDQAGALLGEVRTDLDATTAGIRRLVYDLRPPLIDELGLVAALRNHPLGQRGFRIGVTPDELPDLPAAVEVALYRIAVEALHNAVRHSGAARVEIVVAVAPGVVVLTVTDDGRGLPDPLVEGVGTAAMRERAAELGGTLGLGGAPGLVGVRPGTRVTATVPLPGQEA